MGRRAEPWCRTNIKQKIFEMTNKSVSDKYVWKLIKAYPDIQPSKARGLDSKRARAFNRPNVFNYFDLLEDIVRTHQIPQENIYNFNEKGVQLGGGHKNSSTLYFFDKEDRNNYIRKSDFLILFTIIEAACADGTPLPPAFILPKGDLPEWWNWEGVGTVTVTDSGWTNDSICHQWFSKVFLPFAKGHGDQMKKILLILDRHGSHETIEMVNYAAAHGVELLNLPAHTTHKLQPLDVGVFGLLQCSWIKHCEYLGIRRRNITHDTVVPEYMKVRELIRLCMCPD
ncbi:hypothetical protein M422DRAFT_180840 [Sphaerobolus stellatus SS14]|uniref:DDE-1 domain-containing protein n=1 Tax=Sphaerobolus stellatus (strain SS14) TaxID=990650 RepID=A0A0C9V1C8_SPHS4|nr:hypothetical protein M422DRAFT_180840 [Sphaerobolus stellatus SS14]